MLANAHQAFCLQHALFRQHSQPNPSNFSDLILSKLFKVESPHLIDGQFIQR